MLGAHRLSDHIAECVLLLSIDQNFIYKDILCRRKFQLLTFAALKNEALFWISSTLMPKLFLTFLVSRTMWPGLMTPSVCAGCICKIHGLDFELWFLGIPGVLMKALHCWSQAEWHNPWDGPHFQWILIPVHLFTFSLSYNLYFFRKKVFKNPATSLVCHQKPSGIMLLFCIPVLFKYAWYFLVHSETLHIFHQSLYCEYWVCIENLILPTLICTRNHY